MEMQLIFIYCPSMQPPNKNASRNLTVYFEYYIGSSILSEKHWFLPNTLLILFIFLFSVWGMFSIGSSIRVLGPQLLVLFGETMQPWWRKNVTGVGSEQNHGLLLVCSLPSCVGGSGSDLGAPAPEACCHAFLPLGLYFLEPSFYKALLVTVLDHS